MNSLFALLLAQSSPFLAGFAEEDITPPLGTPRQGANAPLRVERVLDPIFARAAVFEVRGERLGLVQLDLAMVQAADVAALRARVARDHGVDGRRVMVAATHNHAGPAVMNEGLPRDEAWVGTMIEKSARAFGRALAALRPARAGVGRALEWDVAFNRRVLLRDGTARTHGRFRDPDALAFDGPVDPEVGVFAVKALDGAWLGAIVNFACHPGNHWDKPVISAGWPGGIARALRGKGIPVTLFLQGAAGDISTRDPRRDGPEPSMDEIGRRLADDAWRAVESARWSEPDVAGARAVDVELDVRRVSAAERDGTARGTQRFGAKDYYAERIPRLVEELKAKGVERAEVQVLRVGDVVFVAQPSESFAEFGLRIKTASAPLRAFVACYANGMVGYLPTSDAFRRGGYEASFGPPSCMAPDAGDRLADAAIDLVRALGGGGRPARVARGAPRAEDLAEADRGGGLLVLGTSPGTRPREGEPEGELEVTRVDAGHPLAWGLPRTFRVRAAAPAVEADPDGPGIQVIYEARSPRTGRSYPAVWTLRHPTGRVACVAVPIPEIEERARAWASRP